MFQDYLASGPHASGLLPPPVACASRPSPSSRDRYSMFPPGNLDSATQNHYSSPGQSPRLHSNTSTGGSKPGAGAPSPFAHMTAQIKPSPIGIAIVCVSIVVLIYYMFRSTDISTSSAVSVRELLSASIDLAERGGYQVKMIKDKHKENQDSKGETREGANDPVTDGDYLSHVAIVQGFKKAFPSVKVVSEEHSQKGEEDLSNVVQPNLHSKEVSQHTNFDEIVPVEEVTVWVDPLDATQEYTEDLLQYVTVMVCIARKGVPIAGVIHKPFEDKTYWAYAGSGLSPKLIARHKDDESKTNIIVSRSHKGDVEKVVTDKIQDSNVIPAGGAGYKVLSLFQGEADAYVHTTLIKKWDICAGNALLSAMSGKMTDLNGNTISYHHTDDPKNEHGLLATLTDHEKFLELLKGVKSRA